MMLTTVPFAGFYGSVHEQELDWALENFFQDENGDPNHALIADYSEHLDWQPILLKYAEAYVENFALRFEVKIEWESMSSPREYNFTTDRIFAHISLEEVQRLRQGVVSEKAFRDACIERHTSYNGFISSYSNDPDDWGPIEDWDHNQVGTLLVALANQESHDGEFDSDDEVDLMEYERCNGCYDEWFWLAAKGKPEMERTLKIHDYLRERQARKWRMHHHDLTTIQRA